MFHGTGTAAKNLLPPGVWSADSELKDYDYDPEKAKALLKEAGFANGVSIELWAMPVQRPYNPNAKRMAEMIRADWAKVGVQTKIVTYEWGEYLKRVKGGEHQAALMGWTTATGIQITSSARCLPVRPPTAGRTRPNGAISRLIT